MGQYSQWEHYRTIDQQLQAQRAKLEQNLHDLQEQARHLEADNPHAPNSLIQALQQYMHAGPRLTALSPEEPSTHHLPVPEPSTSTAIPAVYPRPRSTHFPGMIEHSRYTDPKIPVRNTALKAAQLMSATTTSTCTALQLTSHMHIIPAQDTLPQEALRYTGHTRPTNQTLPVDPQDEHTDQMIQRWFVRWGKHQQNKQNIQDT